MGFVIERDECTGVHVKLQEPLESVISEREGEEEEEENWTHGSNVVYG